MKTLIIGVIVIAALVGLVLLVFYKFWRREQKSPRESAEVRDAAGRRLAAQRRSTAAGERITGWRRLAAQRRSTDAGERSRSAAIRGARWKIFEFFVRNTAAWGILWYFLISVIGVNYSWGFYRQLDIHVFDFFNTPDFLLSAFQNITTLITGVLLTLLGVGIFFSLAYHSSIDSARDFRRDPRVRREAIILAAVTLVAIILLAVFVLFFFWWTWLETFSALVFGIIALIVTLVFLAYRSIKKMASHPASRDEQAPRVRQETSILGAITLGVIIISFFSWWQLPQVFPRAVLSLISVGILLSLVVLARRFMKLAFAPVRRADQVRRDVRILLSFILVEATFVIPFLWGGVDSYAALENPARSVKILFHRNADQPNTRLPRSGRTLFIGTTSSFHFFYECEELATDSTAKNNGSADKTTGKNWRDILQSWIPGWWTTLEQETTSQCEKGRPFIVPTVSIASLEFNPPHRAYDTKPKPPATTEKCHLEESYTVTHFPESQHDRLKVPGKESLTELFKEMTRHFKNYRLDRLILTGRVDIDKFKSREEREFYGTQIDLARSRAGWMQKKLLKKFPTQIDLERITLDTAGPRYINRGAPDFAPALDRSVEVWACWAPKESEQASTPANPAE